MKSLIKIVLFSAFIVIAGYSVYPNQKAYMPDWVLANVEVLAGGESGKDIYCCGNHGECMKVIDNDGIKHTVKGVKSPNPCP